MKIRLRSKKMEIQCHLKRLKKKFAMKQPAHIGVSLPHTNQRKKKKTKKATPKTSNAKLIAMNDDVIRNEDVVTDIMVFFFSEPRNESMSSKKHSALHRVEHKK